MPRRAPLLAGAALLSLAVAGPAAAWEPEKTVEFIVASSAGGGSDQFARLVQSIITEHELVEESVVVTNKGGGSGSEAFVYAAAHAGDAHKLVFGTNNEWLLPLVAEVGYTPDALTPVAALAVDQFLWWVQADAPFQTMGAFVDAAKAEPKSLRVAGSQSKDTDQTLVMRVERAAGAAFTYVPFKGGGAVATQLAGGHVDANVNNPAENLTQWRAGNVRPLCVFSPERMGSTAEVADGMSWADVPTCKEQGVALESYEMPRTTFLPAEVEPDAVAFYVDLMRKVTATPEWQDYLERTVQAGRFMAGDDFAGFIEDDVKRAREDFAAAGWLVSN